MKQQMSTRRSLAIGLIAAACLLGILNSGGYRYGISDQAFYLPAVIQHLDSSLFPRDRALLHAQDRFMLFDDGAAAMVKTTGLSVPTLFLGIFLVGLVVHFAGCVELGRRWYRSWWSVAALAFILTMRHRITLTGANTLEGYLHPRSLAFAVGVWALVAFLSGRTMIAITVVALAGALHTTTALWFAIWIGVAIVVADARWRWPLAIATAAAGAAGIWLLWFGPMREQLQQMDMRWVSVLALKDYLFPTEWPVSAWLINLAYPLIVWIGYRVRVARSVAHPREKPLVFGALALAVVFLLSLPFVLMRVALAVQLQVSRVFWMLELMATLYLTWMAIEWAPKTSRMAPVRRWVTVAVALVAVSRGVYIMQIEQAGRSIIQVRVPEDQWTDVMRWLRSTPPQTHVLADPNHAFRYGTSERVLGERDVLLEGSKDTALAIYSRAAAERVIERIQAVGDFDALQPETIRALAAKYNLDYMITERRMTLPRVYENGRFTVYVLKDSSQ
jgi:hypothetical protein